MRINPSEVASRLTEGERAALRSLPVADRGNFGDEQWWCYYMLLDGGLLTTDDGGLMVPTDAGAEVLRLLDAG